MDTLQSKVNGLWRAAFLTARSRYCLTFANWPSWPVSVRDGGDVDLSAQVSSEFLKIVDELEGLHQAGEQGRAN